LLVAKAFLSFPFASLFSKKQFDSPIKLNFHSFRSAKGGRENCACHFYCPILKFRPLCHAASEQRYAERYGTRRNERGRARAAQAVPAIILGVSSWQADRNRDERKAIIKLLACQGTKARFSSSLTHMECAAQSTLFSFVVGLPKICVAAMSKH
jgi:hypothetical protein